MRSRSTKCKSLWVLIDGNCSPTGQCKGKSMKIIRKHRQISAQLGLSTGEKWTLFQVPLRGCQWVSPIKGRKAMNFMDWQHRLRCNLSAMWTKEGRNYEGVHWKGRGSLTILSTRGKRLSLGNIQGLLAVSSWMPLTIVLTPDSKVSRTLNGSSPGTRMWLDQPPPRWQHRGTNLKCLHWIEAMQGNYTSLIDLLPDLHRLQNLLVGMVIKALMGRLWTTNTSIGVISVTSIRKNLAILHLRKALEFKSKILSREQKKKRIKK